MKFRENYMSSKGQRSAEARSKFVNFEHSSNQFKPWLSRCRQSRPSCFVIQMPGDTVISWRYETSTGSQMRPVAKQSQRAVAATPHQPATMGARVFEILREHETLPGPARVARRPRRENGLCRRDTVPQEKEVRDVADKKAIDSFLCLPGQSVVLCKLLDGLHDEKE